MSECGGRIGKGEGGKQADQNQLHEWRGRYWTGNLHSCFKGTILPFAVFSRQRLRSLYRAHFLALGLILAFYR